MQPAAPPVDMGPIVVMVSLVVVTFVGIFLVLRYISKKNAAHWRAYASRRSFSFTPSGGFGPAYRGPRMEGVVGGVPLLIDGYFHRMGRGPVFVTRVTRSLPVQGSVVVRPRNAILLLDEQVRGAPLLTGDAAFDATLVVGSDPPGVSASLLPGALRARLLAFASKHEGTYLDVTGGQMVLRWFGYEKDDSALDEACALVAGTG